MLRAPMTAFWLCAWAATLACAWLLPNHYPPWSTFHMDAWVATVLGLGAGAIVLRTSGPVHWSGMAVVAAVIACMPLLQFSVGQIFLAGTAWINFAYLLGFVLALLTGSRWDAASPGQLMDGLFLAIGLAAIVSVGVQLHQWLYLERLEMWVMPDNFGRPFGNFGQPNQLATFHLWGLLALAWGCLRGRIGAGTAVCATAYLLFGLALTASRASWLGVAIMVLAAWAWRRHWPDRRVPAVVTSLAAYFVVCVVSVSALREILLGGSAAHLQELTRATMVSENRPAIWSMFVDAALRKPWLGYGWGQAGLAHVAVAAEHTPKYVLFSHAHNLPLDFIVWCGIPIGLLLVLWLVRWFWVRLRQVGNAQEAVLMSLLMVVANHAMLELPLHHAYFLLPAGLVVGVLDRRLAGTPVLRTGRWAMALLWAVAMGLLALIIRDYTRVEPEYQKLRFEWARVKTDAAQPPEVLLLDQFPNFVRMVRFEPASGMSPEALQWTRDIVGLYPNPATFQKLAIALALNGRPEEAERTLRAMCKMVVPVQCAAVTREWVHKAGDTPAMRAVAWPPK